MLQPIKRNVLYIEDAEADILIMQKTLEQLGTSVNLIIIKDGELALKYLRREAPYENAIVPHIIILDLNLPKINGFEVLEEAKKHPYVKKIPIIVLTTSRDEDDKVNAYSKHANAYITKPVRVHEFREIMKTTNKFWFEIVELPEE